MKMERAYPPPAIPQLISPLLVGEQGCFILADGSAAKISDRERQELETLAYEACAAYLRKAGHIDDRVLQDAFEETHARLLAANSQKEGPVSMLCVVKEEGATSCLVASTGGAKLFRVDGDRVELAIIPSKKGKPQIETAYLGTQGDAPVYLAKIELGADEVLVALSEKAYRAQNLEGWKKRLANSEMLSEEMAKVLKQQGNGVISWILYPHEDSVPSLPPKRKGLTFSVSLILLACLAILGTSVWMKERRTLLGRATPDSAHLPQALVKQEMKTIAATNILDEEADLNFAAQELEIAQLRDAIQEVAEVGGDETLLLKQIISAQEEKIAQMANKEAALAQKLESQEEYVTLLQASLALLQEGASPPADTLSLQLSEALESKEMLEKELEAIAAHTALLDQHREEVARLRSGAEEYQETQDAYEEVIQLCATQSEELVVLEKKVADDEMVLHRARETLSQKEAELEQLVETLAATDSAKNALESTLEEEKRMAAMTQDQLLAMSSKIEMQECELAEARARLDQLQGGAAQADSLEQRCRELAVQVEGLEQEKALLGGDTEALQALLTTQERDLTEREGTMLELQQELDMANEALATAEKALGEHQQDSLSKEELIATLQLSENERLLKLDETEGARALLTQQIDELTESHRLLHSEKLNLEAQVEKMAKDLVEKETKLAVVELEQQKYKDATAIAEETRKALQQENLELGRKIASLQQVEHEYAKEHLLRRESDEMLGRLATNIQGWKEAVNSMEESRKALAEELAELKAYQSTMVKGKVQKVADKGAQKKRSVTRIHLVSPGETLEGIARRYYGNTQKVDDIREANEDLLSEGQQIRVGTALVIP